MNQPENVSLTPKYPYKVLLEAVTQEQLEWLLKTLEAKGLGTGQVNPYNLCEADFTIRTSGDHVEVLAILSDPQAEMADISEMIERPLLPEGMGHEYAGDDGV